MPKNKKRRIDSVSKLLARHGVRDCGAGVQGACANEHGNVLILSVHAVRLHVILAAATNVVVVGRIEPLPVHG